MQLGIYSDFYSFLITEQYFIINGQPEIGERYKFFRIRTADALQPNSS